MEEEILIPLAFFTFLTLVIVLPVYWRHRQNALQLDVVAKALEKGVDPERIQLKVPTPEQLGDPNGNWKAGLILIAFGLFTGLCVMLPLYYSGELSTDGGELVPLFAAPGSFIIPGIVLLFIHYTIVGRVIKRGEKWPPSEEQSGRINGLAA
jgi:hypothetical protein